MTDEKRDPRIYPREGDVLYESGGSHKITVVKVNSKEVAYYVTDYFGGLIGSGKIILDGWRKSAVQTCGDWDLKLHKTTPERTREPWLYERFTKVWSLTGDYFCCKVGSTRPPSMEG